MDRRPSRREFIATTLASIAGVAGCSGPSATPTKESGGPTGSATSTDVTDVESVDLEPLASGFPAPLDIAYAPEADRRYIADQQGSIYVHEADGVRDEPFLDLGDEVTVGLESGLLGMALHPDFADNRRVFVRYSAPTREGTPSSYSHTFVLAEFEASADGRRVDPESERTLLEIPEPQFNHNAGDLAFGPEGYLYVPVGDGGASGDQGEGHAEDWYDGNGGGNGQDVTTNLLGSILRIDVDSRTGEKPYGIPDDNPLVGREGLDEHYAWGLRNPWRMSFDGDTLIAGDVGQNNWEEIDVIEMGGNYGWNVKEGTHCFEASTCPDSTPSSVRGGEPLRDPVVEYPHGGAAISGVSVIGGYVYRGSALPGLGGRYVFGDLQTGGHLFVALPTDDGPWPTTTIDIRANADRLQQLRSFGVDADGELYAVGTGGGEGGLVRIVPAE